MLSKYLLYEHRDALNSCNIFFLNPLLTIDYRTIFVCRIRV